MNNKKLFFIVCSIILKYISFIYAGEHPEYSLEEMIMKEDIQSFEELLVFNGHNRTHINDVLNYAYRKDQDRIIKIINRLPNLLAIFYISATNIKDLQEGDSYSFKLYNLQEGFYQPLWYIPLGVSSICIIQQLKNIYVYERRLNAINLMQKKLNELVH